MKTRFIALAVTAVCFTALTVWAQVGEEGGWFNAGGEDWLESVPVGDSGGTSGGYGGELQESAAIAEAITPEIEALARGLENDPQRIFNYVRERIRYVHYFGSKKGAQLTLLEGSGNDFDQCALLMALLRSAGYTNASYRFGVQKVPYESGDQKDYRHLVGLSMANTNWTNSIALAGYINWYRGYPYLLDYLDNTHFAFHRVWVALPLEGSSWVLDPAFKQCQPVWSTNFGAAIGLSSNALWTAAGGTVTTHYVQNLTEATLRSKLQEYTTNLLNHLRTNHPNASVEEFLGVWQPLGTNPGAAWTTNTTWPVIVEAPNEAVWPVEQWQNIPTNWVAQVKVAFANGSTNFYAPALQGRRLLLNFTNGQAELWLEDDLVLTRANVLTDGQVNVTLTFDHPHKQWNHYDNTWTDTGRTDHTVSALYRTNGVYALLYAYETSPTVLRKRQEKLDAYRQQGLADTSRQVLGETLNIMGLNWMLQTELCQRMLALQHRTLSQHHHRLGRMAQEPSWGYYVDVYAQLSGVMPTDVSLRNSVVTFGVSTFFQSAMEHGLIEQLQSTNLVAASTVKMFQLGNTNGLATYLVTSGNWSTVQSQLTHYDNNYLYSLVTAGHSLVLPQDGQIQISGPGSWKGYGIADYQVASGSIGFGMLIRGGYQGGYSGFSYSTVSPSYLYHWNYAQPTYFNLQPSALPTITGADPVNMVDGSFVVDETDLALGQLEPRGLKLARSYSSRRRHHDLTGLGFGWVHNLYFDLAEMSAAHASLGQTTPAQMSPLLVATRAALDFFSPQAAHKNWAATALITKWAVDQMRSNAVSITLGADTVQFVKQPDGTFTPPAGSKLALLKTNSVYWLQERHGNTFRFNAVGQLTNLVDQYNQSLTLTYQSSTNRLPQTATDSEGRSLTFNYTSNRLTSVSDGSRTVAYGYSGGNLVAVADPESKTNTFAYDTNHLITATLDALNQLVVSNLYDGFGRVVTQYTRGDPGQTWQLFWTGYENIEQDPTGAKRRYFHDAQHRLIATQDALDNVSRTFYDGQDHVVMTVSPFNETNRFEYDGRHNLLRALDALGFTNHFHYDAQDQLLRTVDARGSTNRFGYNAQHSLIGFTNGAGNWVTFGFNTDGTLAGVTNAGGATAYGYDSYGQLNRITHPSGLGSEGSLNSPLGDVLSHTNARQFVTSFQYNARRELTNTIAPTNLTAKIAYDAVGNVWSTTDARGFTTTNAWSATRKLLITSFPATPQGTPVITNGYDSRDWLARTVNPLQQATLFTNDAAGRLIALTDPIQRTTRFGYDAANRKIGTTNAAWEATRQQWNQRGELTQTITRANTTIKHSYDAAGNQITLTNRNGKRWQFQYDAANRLTNTISPRTNETRLSYDARGLLSTVREPSGQWTTNFYDARGRLTNLTDAVGVRWFSYDANNNLTAITNVGQASRLSWGFDAYNRVTAFTNADGYVIQYRYDANGNLTNLAYPGNRAVAYAYDSLNRLTNVTDWANHKTTFVYDLANRLTTIIRPNGTTREIKYDAAGQTTNIVEKMAIGVPIAFYKLGWNNAARMEWEFAAPLPASNPPPSRSMTFDDDNRLATFNGNNVTHDNDGNMTYGPRTNNTLGSYDYDARNRLRSAGGLSYGYDPGGNRTSLTNGENVTRFVINPNAAISQVLMRIKGGVTNYYIYGLGLLYEVTETVTGTNRLTYHYDYRGSTVALSRDNGLPTSDRIQYSAYGGLTHRAGTNDTPFLFNGRYGVQTDANGLLHMRARYYNPYLCRFLNPDPIGFAGGLNFYAYADGNPVSLLDPFGLGAMGAGSFSWLNYTANDRIRDDFMAGYHQMQAQTAMAWNMPATPSAGQTLSSLLNMTPFVGGFKMAGEAFFGSDFVTGQGIDSTWSHAGWGVANLGVSFLGVAQAGAARSSVTMPMAATSVATPHGAAVQATTAEAQAALRQVQSGATVYRQGWTGTQRTFDAQNWALQNPATTPNFANQLGMPATATQGEYFWMMGGRVTPRAPVITRPAPGIGGNVGGSMEAVVNPGGVGIDWFHMP